MSWSQECRISGELGAPATSLIIENDHAAVGERFEVRTDVIYACSRPTVNHDDRVVAGSDHLVEDLGTTRTGQLAVRRSPWYCLVPATHRSRDEDEQSLGEVRHWQMQPRPPRRSLAQLLCTWLQGRICPRCGAAREPAW